MTSDAKQVKLRGRPTVLPVWWLNELDEALTLYRQSLEATGGRWSWQRLANDLTAIMKRELNGKEWRWDRKTVERFVNDENPTEELVEAFCKFFPTMIINPTFVARSRKEALLLGAVRDKLSVPITELQQSRLSRVASARSEVERRLSDQTQVIGSKNATSKGGSRGGAGRRHRSVE